MVTCEIVAVRSVSARVLTRYFTLMWYFLRIIEKLLGSSIGRERARLLTPCSGLCGYCLQQLVRSKTLTLICARLSYRNRRVYPPFRSRARAK
jgi:hypothetical protein